MTLTAAPAMAQVASLSATGPIADTGHQTIEELQCDPNTGGTIRVQLTPAPSQPTTVHVFAITQSGPDRFRDAPGRLAPGDNRRISNGGPVVIPANSSAAVPTRICWRNDIIDSGFSEVMVVIANGPGYTVSPTAGRLNFSIFDNDACTAPATTPGGVFWKENPDCRCATKSTNDRVERLTTPEPRDGQSMEAWQQIRRNVAQYFHDPSYLYCADSPYKGLP